MVNWLEFRDHLPENEKERFFVFTVQEDWEFHHWFKQAILFQEFAKRYEKVKPKLVEHALKIIDEMNYDLLMESMRYS